MPSVPRSRVRRQFASPFRRRCLALFTVIALLCSIQIARAGATLLMNAGVLKELKCELSSKEFRLTGGNAPGFLFHPDEPVNLTFHFTRGDADPATMSCVLEIQGVSTAVPAKTETYVDPYGKIDALTLEGAPVSKDFDVTYGEAKEVDFELKDLPVPVRYGTYALVLVRGGERRILGTLARVMKPRVVGTVNTAPVFGEGSIFGGFGGNFEAASACYTRMGIRGLRCEISWRGNKPDGTYDWTEYDKLTSGLKAGGIQAMFTLGGVDSSRYGIPTKGQPIPAAVPPNWDGNPYWGNADWGCGPQNFDGYEAWIKEFCERYWEGGKGALWGFENYNEPWEGGGISGYARDMVTYREWQRRLARAAHSVSPDIMICGASSIMNTEDKLYSEGPDADGKYEFDQYIDVFTDHYVPPFMAYGPMVAKAHGKASMENETWLVCSEYLMAQVMCQWMASGQRAVMPFHQNALFDSVAGGPRQYYVPTTVPAATAAFSHFVTGLTFNKLVFHDHLPWLFQFGADADPNGVTVVLGQLLTRGGPTPQDLPKARLWAQVDSVDGGAITVDNVDGALRFYDLTGNELYKGEKSVTLPLSYLPTYVQADGGPAVVAARFKAGTISDKYPAEILPHDFTARIGDPNLTLKVDLTNRLNRPLTGTFTVTAPEGFELATNNLKVELAAGAVTTVELHFKAVKEDASNQYPFAFSFATDAGVCAYSETLNCTVVVKRTVTIDGNLDDWAGIPGIALVGHRKDVNPDELARKPWMRLLQDLPEGAIVSDVRLAWDADNLYVAARVNDATPQTDKTKMEGRDEDSYFHNADSDNEAPWKDWLAKHAPGHSMAEVPYIYKKKPFDNSYGGDQLQLAFNVRDGFELHDIKPVTDVPYGFHAVPDTDYEFSAYLCADGSSELWNLLAPGMPRIHDWPHQPKGKIQTNPTPGARHVVKQDGTVRIYEIAIPRATMPELNLATGSTFKFTFHIGNNKGEKIDYGEDKAVTKINGLTLHPYWESSPSCDVQWALVE